MRYEIKELGLGGILDQAVALVKNHFGLLMGIVLVLYFPFTLLATYFANDFMQMIAARGAAPGNVELDAKFLSTAMIMVPLGLFNGLVVGPLTNAAVIHAIASEYLERPTTVGRSMSRAFSVILPLLGTTFLFIVIVYAGLFLCIIPGVIWLFQNILYSHVVVIEGLSGMAALRRSKQLMLSNRTKHFNTIFLLGLMLAIINIAANAGVGIIPQPIVRLVLQVIIGSVLVVFATAAGTVFYFSCRCKAENFDLTLLAESVATDDAGAAGFERGTEE